MLRSSLTLSLITGKPFRMVNVRARRSSPGLMRQHLSAVLAAAEVGQAQVLGASLGSLEIEFIPGKIKAGAYTFCIGTAGSTTLVLQTVLPALIFADSPSELNIEGGTHNPHAPPFDFLQRAYLPILRKMGPEVVARLERYGFYPAGGGRLHVDIKPASKLQPIQLLSRGAELGCSANAVVVSIERSIAERELQVVQRRMRLDSSQLYLEEIFSKNTCGNVLWVEVSSEHISEVFCGFGERGVRAEQIAKQVSTAALRYLSADIPVGQHLADQLVLLCALAGSGRFRTTRPSQHLLSQVDVIRKFLSLDIRVDVVEGAAWEVSVERRC